MFDSNYQTKKNKNTQQPIFFTLYVCVCVCLCCMYVLLCGASEINHTAERDGEACQRLAHRGLGSPTQIKTASRNNWLQDRRPHCRALCKQWRHTHTCNIIQRERTIQTGNGLKLPNTAQGRQWAQPGGQSLFSTTICTHSLLYRQVQSGQSTLNFRGVGVCRTSEHKKKERWGSRRQMGKAFPPDRRVYMDRNVHGEWRDRREQTVTGDNRGSASEPLSEE